ncbi:hypothetical protein HK101_006812, partial [Irineochytrium annulatum]
MLLHNYNSHPSAEFRHLLRCAALVGPMFTIAELLAIWDDPNPDPNEIARESWTPAPRGLTRKIKCLLYLFSAGWIEKVADALDGFDRFQPFPSAFRFRTEVMTTVVASIPAGGVEDLEGARTMERARHVKLINLYETVLTDATETLYIPLICSHHSRASLTDRTSLLKRIQYLDMMGTYMVSFAQSYVEARDIYKEIEHMTLSNNFQDCFGPTLLADWICKMARAYAHGVPSEVNARLAMDYAKRGLALLKSGLPSSDSGWLRLMGQGTFLLVVNILSYGLFIKPLQMIKENASAPKGRSRRTVDFQLNGNSERFVKLAPLLHIISDQLFRSHARLRNQIAVDLYSLNVALRTGRK